MSNHNSIPHDSEQVQSDVNSSQSPNKYKKLEIKTKEQFINQKLKQGNVWVKINFQYLSQNQTKTISRKALVHQNKTLLDLQQSIKNSFFVFLAEKDKDFKIRPEDGVFFFIKNQKIVQLRSKIKELSQYMLDGPDGKYLEITGTTVQKFGSI